MNNTSNLKVVFWNSRSIRNKYMELGSFLFSNHIDICLLSETWLNKNDKFYIPNYKCIRKDRAGQLGGGVAILIKDNLKFRQIRSICTEVIENIGIEIQLKENEFVQLYSVYFPGGQNNSNSRGLFRSDLRKIMITNSNYIFCGDLNARHRDWNCLRANVWGNVLKEIGSSFPTTISFPNSPTYIPAAARSNPSTLDLILTNIPQHISHPCVINDLSSDHLPVSFNLTSSVQPLTKKRYNFSRADWKFYKRYIRTHLNFDCVNVNCISEIDSHINIFTSTLLEGIKKCVPLCPLKSKFVQLPDHILQLIKLRNLFRRDWMRYRQISDLEFVQKYTTLIRNEIRFFRNCRWNEMLRTLDVRSKPFWNVSKILKKKTVYYHGLRIGDNTVITDVDKANAFANTFSSNHELSVNLGTRQHNQHVDEVVNRFNEKIITTPESELLSVSELKSLICSIKKRKSCGLDEIGNDMLKHLPHSVLSYLTSIFNACLMLQYFPESWKTAKVIPIPKPGMTPNSPGNFRPISLLSSLGKLFEKVLCRKIVSVVESNQILPEEQFGFRRSHSTIHQVKRICNDVKSGLNSGKSTGLILLDVEKAFDSVWHHGLVFKLLNFKFPLYLVRLVNNFLTNRKFCVHFNDTFSEIKAIKAGVPQGSVLGPILYNIFTADIPRLNSCKFAAYADDVGFYCTRVLSQDVLSELQCALDTLVDYYFKWKIKLNASKTQAIYFSRRRKSCYLPCNNLKIYGIDIPWLEKVKYLGIHLDKKLSFSFHISCTVDKIKLYTKILYPLISRNSALSMENKIVLFKVIFQAILLYGCPVWGNCAKSHLKRLQIAQNKVLKLALKLPWDFPTLMLHTISGVHTVVESIERISSRFQLNCSVSDNPLIVNLFV